MRTRWLSAVALAATAVGVTLGQFGPKPVAVVNGEAIPVAELEAALAQRPQAVTPLTIAQKKQMQGEIVQALVDERLMAQFLAKQGVALDAAEAAKQWAALIEGLKGQGKTLADYCKETQQSEARIKANLVAMLQWTKYAATKVTDADVKKYYDDNKPFFDRATVRCSHIVLRVSPSAPAAERQAAGAKIAALRADIAAGKLTFAEAARKSSECPSASQGGDLGEVARKFMVEEPFAKAAFDLKPGELSQVVTTDFGVHLILVAERKAGEPSEFGKMKDEARECCVEELRQSVLTELRRTGKIEVKLP